MKKMNGLLAIAATLIVITACKKNEGSAPANDDKPVPTAVGTPVGAAASKSIGNNGGTVISSDGKVELEIPAGALGANANITIQPITNNAPNAVSNGYRFTPDGQKFSKPVTLKIHYSDKEAAASQPDLMGIAFQDSSHIWWRINNFTNDAVNKIISAPITHFSDWTLFEALQITPSSATIKVNETVNLEIQIVNTGKDEDEVAPLFKSNAPVNWNASSGTLTGTAGLTRVYKAPAQIPSKNPVAVSAEVSLVFKYHGKSFSTTTLVSNINIAGDNYRLEIVETRDDLKKGLLVTDSASMDVNLAGNGAVITNIKNFAPVTLLSTVSESGCTFTCITDNIGNINIITATGELRIQSPTEKAIQFFFTHSGTHDPSYRQYCLMPAPLPPFDVTSQGTATKGTPLSLFFDLTGDVMHDDGLSIPGYSLKATLTLKK